MCVRIIISNSHVCFTIFNLQIRKIDSRILKKKHAAAKRLWSTEILQQGPHGDVVHLKGPPENKGVETKRPEMGWVINLPNLKYIWKFDLWSRGCTLVMTSWVIEVYLDSIGPYSGPSRWLPIRFIGNDNWKILCQSWRLSLCQKKTVQDPTSPSLLSPLLMTLSPSPDNVPKDPCMVYLPTYLP